MSKWEEEFEDTKEVIRIRKSVTATYVRHEPQSHQFNFIQKTIDDKLKSVGEFDFEIYKKKITHLEEGIKRCAKSTNGRSFRKSTATNKT